MGQFQDSSFEEQRVRMFRFLPQKVAIYTNDRFDRFSWFLVSLNISPNVLSILGLLIGAGAGLFFALDRPVLGGFFIIICGLFDILDGRVAVNANKKSLYGAIFDSSLDRYSEFFIYLGLAVHFREHISLWIIFFTFLGSIMVSYTRARAEGLGVDCRVGIMQRAERMILLSSGSLLGAWLRIFDPLMTGVLAAIAVFSHMAAIQRIDYVRKVEKQRAREKEVSANG